MLALQVVRSFSSRMWMTPPTNRQSLMMASTMIDSSQRALHGWGVFPHQRGSMHGTAQHTRHGTACKQMARQGLLQRLTGRPQSSFTMTGMSETIST